MTKQARYQTVPALPLSFAVTPCPAPRMTKADAWKQRPCVLRYRTFRDQIRTEARRLGYTLQPAVSVTFYLPMPRSWSQRKREAMNGRPHQQRPDLDNLIKALLDALDSEDGFVWRVEAHKRWASEGQIEIETVRRG